MFFSYLGTEAHTTMDITLANKGHKGEPGTMRMEVNAVCFN